MHGGFSEGSSQGDGALLLGMDSSDFSAFGDWVNSLAASVDGRRLFDGMPQKDASGVDRIGALPDGILHHLLSFLPAQAAVRTCVLARRWRHLWRFTTGLRIVGVEGPKPIRELQKFVDHLLILRERTDLDTVEIRFQRFSMGLKRLKVSQDDVPYVNLWARFAVQCKARALTVHQYTVDQPLDLDGLPLVSQYLRTLDLSGVGLQGTFLDFSSCPALEDLEISYSVISVGKISSPSLKRLRILFCRSLLDYRICVSAPCLIYLKLDCFSGRTPLLESMPVLETALLNLGITMRNTSALLNRGITMHNTSHDICQKYDVYGGRGFCGANYDACASCNANNDGNSNCVVLGAISNAKHLELMSSLRMIIFTRDLKWCPTFNKLKTLLLNDYWCMGPDFDSLTCILKLSPVLEKLTLQLVSEGQTPKVEMKGCYNSMERSTVISEHLKIVDVKCYVVDERVAKVLKFLCTLNIRFSFE